MHWPSLKILLFEHWSKRLEEVDKENCYPLCIAETVRAAIQKEVYKNQPGGLAADFMKSQHYRPNLHPDTKWST